jgi:tRNA-dihydrouridine synthase
LYGEDERPVVAQLYGKDPDLFYVAAHAVCELGFDGLDINMGCPSRSVASSGSGAGLIRTPALAHAIMRAARQGILDWAGGQTPEAAGLRPARAELIRTMNLRRNGSPRPRRRIIPLSVKTRLGYDSVVIEEWVTHLLEEQPVALSVHGRTLQQMYRGKADWTAIERAARLARQTDTLLLGNGDLQSLSDVADRLRETSVHGVLVGRGALGRPWFFQRKETMRAAASSRTGGSRHDGDPGDMLAEEADDLSRRFTVMLEHARLFEALYGVERFPHLRKHLGWYSRGFREAAAMRAQMVRASNSGDVERILAEHLAMEALAPCLGRG